MGCELRVAAGLEALQQGLRRFPLLVGDVDLRQVVDVALIARIQLHRGPLGLHRGAEAAALHPGHRHQIISIRKLGIPLEHGPQILHHVGEALNLAVLSLRHTVLEHRKVIANPHVALIEGRGIA